MRADAQTGGRRVALVIGNDTYPGAALQNGRNDARAVANALRELGFSTTLLEDATQAAMGAAIAELGDSLSSDDVAFFFFAGHGISVGGENYLIPVDYRGSSETGARFGALAASQIQAALGRGKVAMIVLDACRNNPYTGQRAGGGGLAAMEARGSLIAFATGAGQTASDNAGASNGLFTQELLKALVEPNLSARDAFYRIRQRVYDATNGRQFPAVYDGLLGEFTFRGGSSPAGSVTSPPPSTNPAPVAPPTNANRIAATADPLSTVWVPIPGNVSASPWRAEFDMGCVPKDGNCSGDEKPRHKVTLTRPYALLATELTIGQARNAGVALPPKANLDDGERMPVLKITWHEAGEICSQLGGRLPTEAEWEFAARGGLRDAIYPWGDMPPNCLRGAVNGAFFEKCRPREPQPAGQFRPNGYGLFDMAGNADEFVSDNWGNYPAGPVVDPTGDDSAKTRVVRGGAWLVEDKAIRASFRGRSYAGARWYHIGVRCARDIR